MPTEPAETALHRMTRTTPTVLWNDSCSTEELAASIGENGAVGATCNPVIVLGVLRKELHRWKDRIPALIREAPTLAEDQLAWRLTEEMSLEAARLLEPVFRKEAGHNGRLSIQTDPRLFRDARALVDQAQHFSSLAPNVIVKIPVTAAGIEAIEEATSRGISINATVSFTVPQAIEVAEAVERGLRRREARGQETATMGPVCTIMVGRLDDWLKGVAEREGIVTTPGACDWAGVAVMKKAYRIYRERGYRLRLLSAAFRNHLHWSEFIGGDVVISPPFEWQRRFNRSEVTIESRMDTAVDPAIVEELTRKFAEFRRAFDEHGMTVQEFDHYGATRRTLRQFCQAFTELSTLLREFLIPNPDA